MKKWLICGFLVLGFAIGAYAGSIVTDSNGNVIPFFSPNGSLTQTLTVNPKYVDGTTYTAYNIYTPSGTTCYARALPFGTYTRAISKSAFVRTLVPVQTYVTRGINRTTPFLNFSGCTAGTVEYQ